MVKIPVTNNASFDFGIFSNEKKKVEQAYVSIDKQGRVYMNADSQRLFGIAKGNPVDLQLGYKDGVIYMIKTNSPNADPNAKPFRFSGERAYASAKTLIEALGISPKGDVKSEKYLYDEDFNQFEGVFAFKKESTQAAEADGQTTIDELLEGDATNEVAATEEPVEEKKPKRNKKEKTA